MLGSTKLFKDLPQDLGDEVLEKPEQAGSNSTHNGVNQKNYNTILGVFKVKKMVEGKTIDTQQCISAH